jgi:hypothetical protein
LCNFHAVFPNSCTNLHFQEQCGSIPFSSFPPQHLLSFVLLIIAFCTDARWSHYGFWCVFPWLMMLNSFSCTWLPFVCLLLRNVYLSLLFLFKLGWFLLTRFWRSLYILDSNSLSYVQFANIFFYTVCCLFTVDYFLWCTESS